MSVVRHFEPARFLAAAQPALARDAAMASLVRSLAHGVERRPPVPDEPVYMATCGSDGRRCAAVGRGARGVVVAAVDPRVAAAVADDLARAWPDLPGVVGDAASCAAFARRWRERTGRDHRLRVRMRHHALTEVAPVPAAPGAMRAADVADLGWLTEALIAFVADAGMPDDAKRLRRDVPQALAEGRYRIWDDGGPTAFAGWGDAGDGDARVAPVFTARPRRRRGYATALVAALARELIGRGMRRIFLLTDIANPTSNAIYARIGFRPLSELHHLDFVAPRASA
jgi:GNAT superfamily N-acetyltransferase